MALVLVDYSSDSDSDDEAVLPPPDPKQRKLSETKSNDKPSKSLPPLPAAFHDLYASTVRQSNVDDPALHHGRTRQVPHVAGRWPSHLYIEWYPSEPQQTLLSALVDKARADLGEDDVELHSFLSSDTGSPLPLHVSLSRPIVLTTGTKDAFLDKAVAAVRASGVRPFPLTPDSLAWYHSPDSNRAFLVLRVRSLGGRRGDEKKKSSSPSLPPSPGSRNPELARLLARCNGAVRAFGQPELYAHSSGIDAAAFHVSIAWTLGNPEERSAAAAAAAAAGGVGRLLDREEFAEIRDWRFDVGGVKIKIGNVVTHVEAGHVQAQESLL